VCVINVLLSHVLMSTTLQAVLSTACHIVVQQVAEKHLVRCSQQLHMHHQQLHGGSLRVGRGRAGLG
jgi:hypothetical protein